MATDAARALRGYSGLALDWLLGCIGAAALLGALAWLLLPVRDGPAFGVALLLVAGITVTGAMAGRAAVYEFADRRSGGS
jgi:hypothetical protein